MKVLIADDDKDIRFVVKEIVEGVLKEVDESLDPILVSSGKEAIETLKKSSVDAAILDGAMPPGSGIETLEYIRGQRKLVIPVIMFSGTYDQIYSHYGVTYVQKTNCDLLESMIRQEFLGHKNF